jgi:hypothetical protein
MKSHERWIFTLEEDMKTVDNLFTRDDDDDGNDVDDKKWILIVTRIIARVFRIGIV